VLSYPAAIPLSTRSLNHLAGLIRAHHTQRRSRWRRLDPGRQALLALAHLRNGGTLTRLACEFEVGVATAWRYVREAIGDLFRVGTRSWSPGRRSRWRQWRTRNRAGSSRISC
jgi:hypothetical protein